MQCYVNVMHLTVIASGIKCITWNQRILIQTSVLPEVGGKQHSVL